MDPEKLLAALQGASTWEEVAERLGTSPETGRTGCEELLRSCCPPVEVERAVAGSTARIRRDEFGVPSIQADNAGDAWLGLGYALGQDRLFQMDYLRRQAAGTLAAVVGPAALASDRLYRTLNLTATARAVVERLDERTAGALAAFSRGINRAMEDAMDNLPFEFRLLGYSPEPWSPHASALCLRGFWWQLTGRFPILCLPEFARRHLPWELYELFLLPEGEGETIWPRGVAYPAGAASSGVDLGRFPDEGGTGSNNWVVGASKSASGLPMLCSDPHVPFGLPSVWYEASISCPAFTACGAGYSGVPGFFFGRSGEMAWGLTNNISSLRDLYLEVTEDFDDRRYLRGAPDGSRHWKGMTSRHEEIEVRGRETEVLEVLEVDHGPVVTDLLPEFMPREETVSLRWVGRERTAEQEVLLDLLECPTVDDARERLSRWSCPTFNFLLADRQGAIGYQLTGAIPIRGVAERGCRPGDDPLHAWRGTVPYEGLPACGEPPEGWLGSCNNVVVDDTWPYPLSGTWPSDVRMRRLVEWMNGRGSVTATDLADLQSDPVSVRAREWAGVAAATLRAAGVSDPLLEDWDGWDGGLVEGSRAAVTFESFFLEWTRVLLAVRLPSALFGLQFATSAGLAERLLIANEAGWFPSEADRDAGLRRAWSSTRESLAARLGVDDSAWRWGDLHRLTLRHPLATTGPLRDLLNRGPYVHSGGWNTLNNSLFDTAAPFSTLTGVSYRLHVDLAGHARGVNSTGQSGHPGSPHYVDQVPLWQSGRYHGYEAFSDGS